MHQNKNHFSLGVEMTMQDGDTNFEGGIWG